MDMATTCIYGLSFLSAGLFLFLPLANLLSPSPWQRYMGAIHGFASLLAIIVVTYAGHLAWGHTMLNARQGKLWNWSTCDKMNEAF